MTKSPTRQVLFENKWMSVVLLDGWFVASEPSASKDNMAVAVLPYRVKGGRIEYLARMEKNPAHITAPDIPQMSIITGACETGKPLYHAKTELLEEGGYDISESRFIPCGIVNPLKGSCTRMFLYGIRIYPRDRQTEPEGDGGGHEQTESAAWQTHNEMLWAKDPYIQTIMMRLQHLGLLGKAR
jgi:8-oxo-dGTP pyrophosphatase MutT (NUDIX family)